jgi:predicted O-linked N-acetylglucosamine transferase (SPINDLY family)
LPKYIENTTSWLLLASLFCQNIFKPLPSGFVRIFKLVLNRLSRPKKLTKIFEVVTDKIHVGYMSSNFGDHSVGHATAGLFQAHDRDRFQIYGFSLSDKTSES